jgi:hypothetical protein
MEFKLWLLYCAFCLKYGITAPSFGEFINGKKCSFIDEGANI